MRRPEFIARQASCPTGFFGRVLARIMATETLDANDKTLELLAIQPRDHVLEFGFGHGRTLTRAAVMATAGFVAGIDVSADMVKTATQWNQQLISERRVAVHCASSLQIPYPSERFDRVYAVHTLYFWRDPQRHLHEIYRVMKPGARFVLTFVPSDNAEMVAKFPATVYHFYAASEVQRLLEEAGFHNIHLEHWRTGARMLMFAIAHSKAPSVSVVASPQTEST
jgi:ubiquinone/menaquinone biosynthesis C-methylase UbiE